MLVEVIGILVFLLGIGFLLAGAIKQPASGGDGGADGMLIGGAMGVVFGAAVFMLGII